MKKYIWGIFQKKKYSILEIDESQNQIVIRPIGPKDTHLTLHKLNIIKESDLYWLVNYQNFPLKLFKNSYEPISFNWNSPVIRGVWSDTKVEVAKACGFLDSEKHATSSQGLLVKLDNTEGYDVGTTKIQLNKSCNKLKYLRDVDKLGEIILQNDKFMIKIILSTQENKYNGKSNFSFKSNLGKIHYILV